MDLISGDMARQLDELGVEFDTMTVSARSKQALLEMFGVSSGEPTAEEMQAAISCSEPEQAKMVQARKVTVGVNDHGTLEASEAL